MRKSWREANREIPAIIWNAAKGKWHNAKSDKRIPAYMVFEWVLILLLLIGIIVYLDPQTNLVPTPYNYVGFAIVLVLVALLYRAAHPYHVERKALHTAKKALKGISSPLPRKGIRRPAGKGNKRNKKE